MKVTLEKLKDRYRNIREFADYNHFDYELNLNELPRNSTDAITYGYLKGLHSEVTSHKKDIFLTGGDAQKLLKIFPEAKIKINLIFDGMKKILEQVI